MDLHWRGEVPHERGSNRHRPGGRRGSATRPLVQALFPESPTGGWRSCCGRAGQVDGKRAESELASRGRTGRAGAALPETLPDAAPESRRIRPNIDPELAKLLEDRILHIDDEFLVIDKPPGLAVQGGTGVTKSVDGALDALTFGKPDRPKLVHRLDRDASGVLVLARTTAATRWATAAFRQKTTRRSTGRWWWAR